MCAILPDEIWVMIIEHLFDSLDASISFDRSCSDCLVPVIQLGRTNKTIYRCVHDVVLRRQLLFSQSRDPTKRWSLRTEICHDDLETGGALVFGSEYSFDRCLQPEVDFSQWFEWQSGRPWTEPKQISNNAIRLLFDRREIREIHDSANELSYCARQDRHIQEVSWARDKKSFVIVLDLIENSLIIGKDDSFFKANISKNHRDRVIWLFQNLVELFTRRLSTSLADLVLGENSSRTPQTPLRDAEIARDPIAYFERELTIVWLSRGWQAEKNPEPFDSSGFRWASRIDIIEEVCFGPEYLHLWEMDHRYYSRTHYHHVTLTGLCSREDSRLYQEMMTLPIDRPAPRVPNRCCLRSNEITREKCRCRCEMCSIHRDQENRERANRARREAIAQERRHRRGRAPRRVR